MAQRHNSQCCGPASTLVASRIVGTCRNATRGPPSSRAPGTCLSHRGGINSTVRSADGPEISWKRNHSGTLGSLWKHSGTNRGDVYRAGCPLEDRTQHAPRLPFHAPLLSHLPACTCPSDGVPPEGTEREKKLLFTEICGKRSALEKKCRLGTLRWSHILMLSKEFSSISEDKGNPEKGFGSNNTVL